MKKKVLVALADGFEEIEAVAAIDVLRRADLELTIAGVGKKTIKGAHGVNIEADTEIGSYNYIPDAIVLPGGMPGVENLSLSEKVNDLIGKIDKEGGIVAAICAAPSYVLAPLGILKGRKATCYPGCEEMLKDKANFVNKDVVVDGNLITSKGPGTALAFALAIVEKLKGKAERESLKKKMAYEEK